MPDFKSSRCSEHHFATQLITSTSFKVESRRGRPFSTFSHLVVGKAEQLHNLLRSITRCLRDVLLVHGRSTPETRCEGAEKGPSN
jgi:hypothetical protein